MPTVVRSGPALTLGAAKSTRALHVGGSNPTPRDSTTAFQDLHPQADGVRDQTQAPSAGTKVSYPPG